jgi:Zn-dependent protease/CBS domain-containing protein
MRWSFRIGSAFGIGIFVHATFLLLLAWIAAAAYLRQGGSAALVGLVFVLAVFGSVVLHELGHALTARHFGIGTRDITLLPIGGVARLEKMPEQPRHELLVALAGPMVNVAIAVGLAVVLRATGQSIVPTELGQGAPFLVRLLWVNVALALFNLVPAFPMDGGRVVRALLAMRLRYVRATRIAAGLGQAIAVLLGLVGLLGNPLLILVAVFVWIGAGAEASAVESRAALEGLPTRMAMQTEFRTLAPDDRLDEAARRLLGGAQVDFPVVFDGRLIGLLRREDLVAGLASLGPGALVSAAMSDARVHARPAEPLEEAVRRMQEAGAASLLVVERGRVVGIVTHENVGELIMVRDALGRERSVQPRWA